MWVHDRVRKVERDGRCAGYRNLHAVGGGRERGGEKEGGREGETTWRIPEGGEGRGEGCDGPGRGGGGGSRSVALDVPSAKSAASVAGESVA